MGNKMHARMPKHFVLEERLERYGRAIEADPAHWRGRWAEACWPLLPAAQGPGNRTQRPASPLPAAGRPQSSLPAASHPDGRAPVACRPQGSTPAAGRSGACSPSASPLGNSTTAADPVQGTDARRSEGYGAVYLDLGCGKGSFLVESARRNPSALFIGMDAEPMCIAYAAQRVCESGVRNAVAVPGAADKLGAYFAPGELAGIALNFPTPHPKAHYARERLTSVAHLLGYRDLLAPGGAVTLRTDSLPLWRFSLETFRDAGYRTRWVSEDVRAEHPGLPATEYEMRLSAQGATVYGICAEPAPLSEEAAQAALAAHKKPRSLMDYLPEDVFSLGYVPYGMERAVENLRNRRLKRPLNAADD